MEWVYRLIIVPFDLVDKAKILCSSVAGIAGDGMFTTPLSESGNLPATHFISAGLINRTFSDILPLNGKGGNPSLIQSLAGVPITEEEISHLLQNSVISDMDVHEFLMNIGLTICREE